jgi:aspartyl-tRNA(Asn)/glutamyl-tRNA(Gln) amidotransferase subunit B
MATAAAARGSVLHGYEPVIGLEVHCQLKTRSKLFCACANRFGDPPNTNVCPVCLALPGALPVLARDAVTLALRAALATGCSVHEESVFERKNYFYPDLPKGYQISQFARPLATDGRVALPGAEEEPRAVRLRRIHMEEDAGKLLHEGFAWSRDRSGVDFNRAGVPLIEIVSEPDLRSAAEAHEYLQALRALLVYAEVSDCNMEQGSLRCDANVSIRPRGSSELGTRTEIKNLNSFANVRRAIEHELKRQAALLASGGKVEQQTLLWNAERGETAAMRSKEDAHDYRYFPEPDLPPLRVDQAWLEDVRRGLPELPAARRARFVASYGLPGYDADVLTQEREVADFFEAAARASGDAKAASNWVMTAVLRKLKEQERALADAPVPPQALAQLIESVKSGTLSGAQAREVFEKAWLTGKAPAEIVAAEGLAQLSDEAELARVIDEIVAQSPEQLATFKKGKSSAVGWFVGQVMRKTGGKANPHVVQRLLKQALERS